ncbi:MAG: AAA family ATPase [Candidatus Tectimicrobiota bacterium]
MVYRFAECTLDTARHTIRRADEDIQLSRKVFEVLCYLITHRERVVSKDELSREIWQGVAISDAALESCVRAVRASVGDSGQAQRVIKTLRGYGYQFALPVEADEARATLPASGPASGPASAPAPALTAGTVCPSCQQAIQEEAIFCAACGTRLRHVCNQCGQETLVQHAFCSACGHAMVTPRPPQPAAPRRTESAERKYVTVLCCTVRVTTPAGERVDIETRHNVVQRLHTLAQEMVQRYGGHLQPVMDERLVLMFGVPVAQEDDARRAVRVGLELRQHVSAMQETATFLEGGRLTLRSGIHTGLMLIGEQHQPTESVTTVVGDVVTGALALQDQAGPGGILCSEATRRLLHDAVQLIEHTPLQVPGQSEPLLTYRVMAERAWRIPGWLYSTRTFAPFVGRQRELATLHDLFAQAAAGRGQVVGLVGEAGIGKSRLLYEFRHSLQAQALSYRVCRCVSYGSTIPYLPVLELVRQHCDLLESDGPTEIHTKVLQRLREMHLEPDTWAPPLLDLLGLKTPDHEAARCTPEARKAQLLVALIQLCLHSTRQHPMLLEIEDLHWIDASSDEWLTALIERIAGVPLLLLVTYRPGYRPGWIDRSYATQMPLHPLGAPESLQLAQTMLTSASVATPLVAQLVAKADGNPFFLEELVRTVVEQGGQLPGTTVPDTVQAVLTARIDRLARPVKRVLQAAAVLGRDVDLRLLQAITQVPDVTLQQHLAHLQAAEFLYATYSAGGPTYLFKHALTQEVAYQSLLRGTRRQYHAEIAHVLTTRFPDVVETQPEVLAQHYTAAAQVIEAIPYWQHAGERALARWANTEAISHFTQALDLLHTLPQTPERLQRELALQLALGAPLLIVKGHAAPEVEQTYARAYTLSQSLGETPQRFSVLIGLWRFYFTQGQLLTSQELAEQCLALAQTLQLQALLQEAHAIVGSTLCFLGQQVTAQAHLEQGITLYQEQSSQALALSRGTDPGVVCLARSSWTLWWLGYPDQARARSRAAIALAQRLAHPYSLSFALHYEAVLHVWCREVERAHELLQASIALMHEHGFVQFLGQAVNKLGWTLTELGHTEQGLAHIRQGLDNMSRYNIALGRSSDLAILAQAYGKIQQPLEGLRVLDEAFEVAHNHEERFYEAELYRMKGELLLQAGAIPQDSARRPVAVPAPEQLFDAALACFQQAGTLARQQGARSLELRAALSASRLLQQHGKAALARQRLADIYDWFREGFDTPDLQEARRYLETSV